MSPSCIKGTLRLTEVQIVIPTFAFHRMFQCSYPAVFGPLCVLLKDISQRTRTDLMCRFDIDLRST